MALPIIMLVVFILVFGGMIYAVMKQLNKTDPTKADTSTVDNISTAQEFLPFEDIKDNMIIMGGHKYRAVIEASSTNYNLKTDNEKELIEISFQRFLNSLTFPVTFYIQTKVMDNTKMLSLMEEELKAAVKQFPNLEDYANIYYSEMSNLNSYIGNNKQKKKYIIVPYEEAITLADLSDDEKYDYSVKELHTRASIIVDGLSSVGVKAKILDTKELAELVYSTYHKDNYAQVENIVNGDFLSLLTQSTERKIENLTEDAKLDWILYEAQMRLKTELLGETVPDFIRVNVEKAIADLDRLRDQTSGYYRQTDSDLSIDFDEDDEISMNNHLNTKR
ncbi:hypothetical protein PP175_27405 (plasmid) [Aneurinibacillus sp. Ricciae_BoGa-3]|uniref:hypothetical protein n=1 Tax=Aneurinibacillus sp. Ricciae_BoGa-3 TaxID=3022697 RepID=UPI0023421CD1|nr:hypothetical protein [Aneurinibacillus sp. Ricciae_BoGa-3]WCK56943.1 hypothetical protein PP175_27520 [Aneurinibacillus sp. Ricciae_BoGa-3]WCK57766.1 hypothetical protein PP175_27405 [Aneurinibacillus sp. Ricciae_BoGa-3]